MLKNQTYPKTVLVLTLILIATVSYSQSTLYWVGGTGNWTNPNKWFKDEAGLNPAGIIPNANTIVKFTNSSSTTSNWIVTIPTGTHNVHSIIVETSDIFRILLDGTSGNAVEMNVYGDIEFLSTHQLVYSSSTYISDNIWRFQAGGHDISTGNLDLLNIEILDGATFNQFSNLRASLQIRMYGGTWNSNNYNVNAGTVFFQDNEPSNAPLTKVFNAGQSSILCGNWESGLTYGSLTVNGNHKIYAARFRGSPKQINGPAHTFHEIHLLEYSDAVIGGTIIEHNNFECRSCEIESIVIEDTGDTKFADIFTVNGEFTVTNKGSRIFFNGGNGRDSEVTFNGTIVTPKVVTCEDDRVTFAAIHTDFSTFIRTTGSLTVSDVILDNIVATGGATFNVSNGGIFGASSGWNLLNTIDPINYIWKGVTGTYGDWDNPSLWIDQSTGLSNGCLPTIFDNVYINSDSKGDIRIPSDYNALCKDLVWTNTNGIDLQLNGTNTLESSLTITGSMQLHKTASITPVDLHEIYFSSANKNTISTNGVTLPEIRFIGDLGEWSLEDELTCDRMTFEGGTFITSNEDIVTDEWTSIGDNMKNFNFGSSHILVNGEMELAGLFTNNVTVDAGTSLIECEIFTSKVTDLYDVQLNNTIALSLDNYAYDFNSLILNSPNDVNTQNDLTLNYLVFKVDGSQLSLDALGDFTINGGIESLTTAVNPGSLTSKTLGTQVTVNKDVGNLCVVGDVSFQDINKGFAGVFNAPGGINNGNNSGISYDDGSLSTSLYWIGGTGEWQVRDNWSLVSGGCPATKDPNNSPHLIFNDFGLYNNEETISVPEITSCGELYFYNSANDINLSIAKDFSAESLVVSSATLKALGNTLIVDGETLIESGGFLTTDMTKFMTKGMNFTSGLYILEEDSNAIIEGTITE